MKIVVRVVVNSGSVNLDQEQKDGKPQGIRHRDWPLYLPPARGFAHSPHVRRKCESKAIVLGALSCASFRTAGFGRRIESFHDYNTVVTSRYLSVVDVMDVMIWPPGRWGGGLIQGLKRFEGTSLSDGSMAGKPSSSRAESCIDYCRSIETQVAGRPVESVRGAKDMRCFRPLHPESFKPQRRTRASQSTRIERPNKTIMFMFLALVSTVRNVVVAGVETSLQ
jgi:hypothetical protein